MQARPCANAILVMLLAAPLAVCRAGTPPAAAGSVIGPQTRTVRHPARKAYPVIYRNAAGKIIDSKTFMQGVRAGQRFSRAVDKQHAHLVFTLYPVGTDPVGAIELGPGSMKLRIHPGQHLPAFKLRTVAGRTVRESSLRGRPTLVNFFFATCEPCIEEIPSLDAYARQHPGIRVLAITFNDKAIAKTFVGKQHFTWPVVYAGNALIHRIGVSVYPMLAVFDSSGRLVEARLSPSLSSSGKLTAAQISHWVHTTLASERARPPGHS